MVCVACILHPNLRDDLYFAKEQAIESCCTKTVTRPCIWLDRLSWNTQDMYSRTSALSLQSDNNQSAIFYENLDARKIVDLKAFFMSSLYILLYIIWRSLFKDPVLKSWYNVFVWEGRLTPEIWEWSSKCIWRGDLIYSQQRTICVTQSKTADE